MKDKPLLIQNGRIVRGDGSAPQPGNLLITFENGEGVISAIGDLKPSVGCRTYDAKGAYLLPAFADIGCRFQDPEHLSRESLSSGTAAAASGGYATLLCEPSEKGEPLSESILAASHCRLLAAIPLSSPERIAANGKQIYSDNGIWISDSGAMRNRMLACAKSESLLISSCMDARLAGKGIANPGRTARMLGIPELPHTAETTALARDLLLAGETGCRLHVRAISLKASAELIRYAKKQGIAVTCGTSPLHFSMTDDDLAYYGSNAKVMPPLRSASDVEAIRESLLDGTIDCVSSLHTPLTRAEKLSDIRLSPFGASGLDVAFPAYVTYMLRNGYGDWENLVRLMSVAPAGILGYDSRLRVGSPADFAVVDPDTELVVSSNSIKSKAINTPYLGLSLYGLVRAVFRNGLRI